MKAPTVTGWIVRMIVLIVLGAGLFFGHTYVADVRAERAKAIRELEATPDRLLETARQRADLNRREADLSRIEKLLVPRSEVVSIVARIEQEATVRGLTIAVPAIEEIKMVNNRGVEVETGGPARDVRLEISISGSPDQIIAFVHSVEHLPYLLFVESWRLTNLLPQGEDPEEPPVSATSKLSVIVAVAL